MAQASQDNNDLSVSKVLRAQAYRHLLTVLLSDNVLIKSGSIR